MVGIIRRIKNKIVDIADFKQEEEKKVNNLISLGVLMWEVAKADKKFLPVEKDKIIEILRSIAT